MVEISMSGSGEGLGWATGPGYSTINRLCALRMPRSGDTLPIPEDRNRNTRKAGRCAVSPSCPHHPPTRVSVAGTENGESNRR